MLRQTVPDGYTFGWKSGGTKRPKVIVSPRGLQIHAGVVCSKLKLTLWCLGGVVYGN